MRRLLLVILLVIPSAVSNGQEYTQLLIPIAGQVEGAYGTLWEVHLKFQNRSSEDVFLSPLADPEQPPCRTLCPSRVLPPLSTGEWGGAVERGFASGGGFLYLDRSKESFVSFGAYLTEIWVGLERHEVTIPVVRTEDLSPGMQTLVHVPLRQHTREHLRLYGIGLDSGEITVRIRDFMSAHQPIVYEATHELMLTPPGREPSFLSEEFPPYPVFALLDLDALLPSFEGPTIIEIEPVDPSQKVWAMASVTTNVEQHVQIIVPQP